MIEFKDYPFSHPIVWHACFHDDKKWWGRKYSHVSLAGYAEDTWLHLDLHRTGVSMAAIFKYQEVEDFRQHLLKNFAVVRVGITETPSFSFAGPMTCVGFAKHVLGVRSCALRPDALFRCLIRDYDGVWINDPQCEGER